jgi:Cysteine-rich secretory protein family
LDSRLSDAARKHSELMAQRGTLSHQFPGEPPLQVRFADENLASDREGENVALDQNAVSAHEGLMHSPPHRRNILDPEYNTVGIGVVRRGANIYVTEDFARRLPQLSEPQAEAAVQKAIDRRVRSRGFSSPIRRAQPQLRRIACNMARNDTVNDSAVSRLPGVRTVFAWTAGDPAVLPSAMDRILSSGMSGGYSLGACLAPSVSHPGGLYWLVMVSY